MKEMKRFVSLLVVLATLAASAAFSSSVYAEDAQEELPVVELTDADRVIVEKLEAFGAITNEYDDIGMYVTRRQMVDIITKYLRLQVSGTNPTQSPFIDVSVKDASIDKITALYNAGIITGDEALKFHPDDNLTYDEAIVFVVNAVGHKLFAAREGGFPTGYHRIAIKLGMLSNLKFQSGREQIPLCDVYKLLESAMEAGAVIPMNFTDGSVDYRVSETETFLSDTYDITEYKGIVTGNENTRLTSTLSNLTDEQIEIDNVVYDTPGYVYATSLGRSVTYYLRKTADSDFEIAFVEENTKVNNLTKVDSKDLVPDKTMSNRIYYTDENDRERHISLANNIDVIYNGKCYSGYGKIENVLPEEGYIEALDNTGDNTAEILFVYAYKDIVVNSIDTYDETFTAMYTNEKFAYDFQEDKVQFYLMPENKKIGLSSLKQWDVATIMESKGSPKLITVYVSRQTVTGMVDEVSTDLGYLIGGEYYKTSNDYQGGEIKAGMSAVFYLNINGKIVASDRGGVAGTQNYAVVAGLDYNEQSVVSEIQLKLFTQDGTFITAPLKSTVNIDGNRYTTSGSGVENILKVLSNGSKNSEGNYYIHSAYVVRYTISDGKISYLDTGKTGEEGKLHEFAAGTSFLLRDNGIMRLTTNDAGTKYARYVPNESYIFLTPGEGKLDETENYKVQRNLKVNYYYRQSGNYTQVIEDYVVYDLNSSDINVADVVLLRGCSVSEGISSNTSKFNVVTKVTSAVDAEGNATKKIYMNESESAIVSDKVEYRKGNDAKYTEIKPDEISSVIKPGYVIQYGTDEDGYIDAIDIMTEYNAETGEITPLFSSSPIGDGTDGYNKVMGVVSNNATDKNLITFIDGSGTENMVYTGSPSVVIYRPKTEKATTGDINSITVGDTVVVRLQKYVNAAEIIVFKQ